MRGFRGFVNPLPSIGRFASADTIVPNAKDPQNYNRYSYVRNNLINRIDPTGHVDCHLLGDEMDIGSCTNRAKRSKSDTDVPQMPSLPPERPSNIQDSTWNTYLTMWQELYGSQYMLSDGRFTDQYLIAMIINIELYTFGAPYSDAYKATLEAVSNQYHSSTYLCKGSCDTLQKQLEWLDNMHAWRRRDGQRVSLERCDWCLGDANSAIKGFEDSYVEFDPHVNLMY